MSTSIESVSGKAKDFSDGIDKWLKGDREASLAKIVVALAALLSGSPWLLLAEPILARVLASLNNAAGRKAVAEIAAQVDSAAGQQALLEEFGEALKEPLSELMSHLTSSIESSADDTLAAFGVQLSRLEDRLLARIAPYADVWRTLRPGTRKSASKDKPSDLLTAAHEAVPFVGRAAIFEQLAYWVEQDSSVSLSLVTGPGGVGKTRLAMEFCARCRARGIPSGFLTDVNSFATRGADKRLVVLDYAEGKVEQLEQILRELSNWNGAPTRIMLIARDRGDWWQGLHVIPETDISVLRKALHVELGRRDGLSPIERRGIWSAGVDAFTGGRPSKACEPNDFSDECWDRPLLLLMHGLVSQHGHAPEQEPELLDNILQREERHHLSIIRELAADDVPLQRVLRQVFAECLAICTLLGGGVEPTDLASFVTVRLSTLLGMTFRPVIATALTNKLRELYPDNDKIAPLTPDLLGEHLVERELSRGANLLIASADIAKDERQRLSMLRVLDRCAARSNNRGHLLKLLRERVEGFALPALTVAGGGANSNEPVALSLEETLATLGDSALSACTAIVAALQGKRTTITNPIALVAYGIAAAHAARVVEERTDEATLSSLFDLLLTLGARLGHAGRVADAVMTERRALETVRKLVVLERERNLPRLATLLVNMSKSLNSDGQFELAAKAAREAEGYARELVEKHGDRFGELLAGAICNLGVSLWSTGELDSAETELLRAMEMSLLLPPGERSSASMAHTALAYSAFLAGTGREKQAHPHASFAVSVFRILVTKRPDSYLRDFAQSLSVYAKTLPWVGKAPEAVKVARDAVDMLRGLAASQPTAVQHELSTRLTEVGSSLLAVDDYAGAVEPLSEAVALLDRLHTTAPTLQLQHQLARALHSLGAALCETAPDRAFEPLRRALGMLQLEQASGSKDTRALARCLGSIADCYVHVSRHEDATPLFEEAINLISRNSNMGSIADRGYTAILKAHFAENQFARGDAECGFATITDALLDAMQLYKSDSIASAPLFACTKAYILWFQRANQDPALRDLIARAVKWNEANQFALDIEGHRFGPSSS